jgi:hypothetical protein
VLQVSFELKNIADFQDKSLRTTKLVKEGASKLTHMYALDLAAQARANILDGPRGLSAPVDQGRLLAGIQVRDDADGVSWHVVSNADHAAYLEWGTGPKGRATAEDVPEVYEHHTGSGGMPPLDIIEAWVRRKGMGDGSQTTQQIAYLIAREIARNGIEARPYLVPALKTVKPKYEAALRNFLAYVEQRGGR